MWAFPSNNNDKYLRFSWTPGYVLACPLPSSKLQSAQAALSDRWVGGFAWYGSAVGKAGERNQSI